MVHLRDACWEDYPGIETLARAGGLGLRNFGAWKRLWVGNPAFEARADGWPLGWVLEEPSGHVVGFLGNIPLDYELQGRRLLAAAANAWVVDADHRSESLRLLGRFLAQKVDLFLNTTASYEAGKAFAAFRAERVPHPDYDKVLFWVTGYAGFCRAALRTKGLPAVAAPVAGLVLRLLTRRARSDRPDGFRVRKVCSFDDRFDDLWGLLARRPKLLRVRDQRSLSWHFGTSLEEDRCWVAAAERGAELIGYAVFIRQDSPAIGLNRVRLADIQVLDDSSAVLLSLLKYGMAECRSRGVHVLEVLGFDDDKRRIMETLRPRKRELPAWPYFYKARSKSLAELLRQRAYWDPGLIDGDGCL